MMGKHVVYLRSRDEAELKASGRNPSDWVRQVVKEALERERSVKKLLER